MRGVTPVSAIAPNDPGIDRITPRPASRLSQALNADSVSTLLKELATPEILDLIGGIAKLRAGPDAPPARELMRTAISAAAAHDLPRALETIKELIVRYPEELDILRTEPALAPIRGDTENLLQHRIQSARADTGVRLSLAAEASQAEKTVPQALTLANQLFATDRYANIVLAGDLAQRVIDSYKPLAPEFETSEADAFGRLSNQVIESVAVLSKRLTPRLLMLIWLATGLLSGLLSLILGSLEVELLSAALPLEIWGAGSVGLLGFSTYRRYAAAPSQLPPFPIQTAEKRLVPAPTPEQKKLL